MDMEAFEAYQDSYAHIREIEFTGCYRGKATTVQYDVKQFYHSIYCNDKPPSKIYEFKPVR
jgi:hypothetical protein